MIFIKLIENTPSTEKDAPFFGIATVTNLEKFDELFLSTVLCNQFLGLFRYFSLLQEASCALCHQHGYPLF